MANWNRVDSNLLALHQPPTIGAEQRRLLDAVLEAPDETGPRLVYADWLLAQRDAQLQARGELIVVQCRGEVEPTGELRQRERDLLDRFGHRWCVEAGLGGGGDWYGTNWDAEFRRGFLEHVMMWIGHRNGLAVRLFKEEPVRTLVLRGHDDAVFARLPEAVFLRRLAGLGLLENGLGDERLARLVASPHVATLRSLRIEDNQITALGVEALVGLPLRALVLRNNQIGSAGAAALAGMTELVELDLGRNPIGDVGALALVASPSLKRLRVTGCGIGAEGREALIARFGGHAVQL